MDLPSPDHLPRGKRYRCFYYGPLLSASRGGSRRPRLRTRGIDGLSARASAPRPRGGWRLPTPHRSGTTAHCLMECCFTAPRAEPWTGATGDEHRRRHLLSVRGRGPCSRAPGWFILGRLQYLREVGRNGNARSSGEAEDDERTSPVERLDEALQHRGSQDSPDSCRRDPGRQRPGAKSARVPAPAVRNRPATSRSTRHSVVSGGSFRRTASS